ncbi:sensor histidine kinase [Pseudonocardia sp. MH-G8]|uniref:sensor histidine kinase n=1 Tax=Pseudonocardia sp. MH-G8 TaxID=1854588 RepID=UPI001E5D9585|nr:histidine kinase [Pseudonocardia sp. MH-G8]
MSSWAARARSSAGWWQPRSVLVQDGLLAAALTAAAFVPTLSVIGVEIGDLPVRPFDAVAVVLVLAQCVPIVVRRRLPAACLAAVGAGFVAHEVLGYPTSFAGIGLYLALYSAGAHQDRWRVPVAVVAVAVYVGFAVVLHGLGSPLGVLDFLAFFLVLALVVAAGGTVRQWRAQELQRRRLAAERATASERGRIARELHDVVTHHVTAMVVQADAAQYLVASAPGRAAGGLAAISDTGRSALTELRSLLDVLEATGEYRPQAFRDLVDRARAAGQPIELDERGEPATLPADLRLTAYRVVQEALTNAMRHAAGRRTVVRVDHGDGAIEIEVTTEGPEVAKVSGTGSGGRGLAGLGERVRLLDGSLVAGAVPGGGFRVHALIPHGDHA